MTLHHGSTIGWRLGVGHRGNRRRLSKLKPVSPAKSVVRTERERTPIDQDYVAMLKTIRDQMRGRP